jgi:leader peptidase (prepilin peptidase)/N-methyltransferase
MTDLLNLESLIAIAVAPFVGSFLGVLISRIPEGETVIWGRSRCDSCGVTLGLPEIVPIIGSLLAGGRCRACGVPIPRLYLLVELAATAVALWSVLTVPGWLAWITCALGWTLLTLAFIDFRELLLPDELTLPLIAAGLAVAWFVDESRLLSHLLGAVLGFAFVALVAVAYRAARRREGIGWGDAKLLAAGGAWLSWEALPSLVLLASLAGLVLLLAAGKLRKAADMARPVPFGTLLAAAIWLQWLYGTIVLVPAWP